MIRSITIELSKQLLAPTLSRIKGLHEKPILTESAQQDAYILSSQFSAMNGKSKDLSSQIERGLIFLEKSCRPITGLQNDSVGTSRDSLKESYFPEDVFTSLNALDLLGDSLSSGCKAILRKFVTPESLTGTVNFNKYQHVIPDDVEDTALYHYVFLRDGLLQNDKRILDVARLIYLNKGSNEIIQLYYTPCEKNRRNRIEAGCLSNAMRFLYYVGAFEEASKTEDYLFDWLVSGKYLAGTRYYHSAETFLFFCSKAVVHNSKAQERFETPLLSALRERVDKDAGVARELYPLDLALWVLAVGNLNKLTSPDFTMHVNRRIDVLRSMQDDDTGAWPKDALFKLGGSATFLGGKVVATIFAVAALQAFDKSRGTQD